MNKDSKYYNLIEKLIKQNQRFVGNEQFLDDIIDDVMSHANSIIQAIDNESVINEFLNKAVNTSIITVTKKINRTTPHHSNSQQLIDKINNTNQNLNINKKYVDNFINGSTKKVTDNQNSENSTEIEDKQITYEQLSDITNNGEFDIEFNDEEVVTDETTELYPDNTIIDNSIQDELQNESCNLFDNSGTNETIDNIIDSNIVQNESIINDSNVQNNEVLDENIISSGYDDHLTENKNTQEQDTNTIELSFDESDNIDNSETDIVISDENSNIESIVNIDNIDNNIDESIDINAPDTEDDSELSLNELNSDEELESASLSLETNDFILNDTELINHNHIAENEPDNPIHHSIYEILSYEQNPINENKSNINFEKIIEDIKNLDTEYPNLNILDIYRLRYKELQGIEKISSTLNISNDEVIKALNLMVNIV